MTVSEPFRKVVIHAFPNIKDNQAYWQFLGYLLFGAKRDSDNQKLLVIASQTLASLENKTKAWKNNNYTANGLLEGFKHDILPSLEWSGFHKKHRKARVIENLTLPRLVVEAYNKELHGVWQNEKQVYLHDGSAFSLRKHKQYIDAIQKEAIKLSHTAKSKETEDILLYMNSLPSNRFVLTMKRHLNAAMKSAMNVENSDIQLSILHTIRDYCQPFYQPTLHSPRLYPFQQSILLLKSEVRKELTKGWTDADLTNAQFATAARKWYVPPAIELLEREGKVWPHLARQYDVDPTKEFKDKVKDVLYGAGIP
jgi:hypothetical protein